MLFSVYLASSHSDRAQLCFLFLLFSPSVFAQTWRKEVRLNYAAACFTSLLNIKNIVRACGCAHELKTLSL